MEAARVWDVLGICLPVFAVLGLGKLLGMRGFIQSEHCAFINRLVYAVSLPALIFNAVARQSFRNFMDPVVIVMPLVALVLVALLNMALARLLRLKGSFAAAFVFGTFWANATYIGFPLCINAYGDVGEAKAAVYNAFVIPFFIVFGYLLIAVYAHPGDKTTGGARIRNAFLNPVMLSAALGIGVALVADQFRTEGGALHLPSTVISLAALLGTFLKMIGSMGLPLALLSIGASLKWEDCRTHSVALAWTVFCKLVLLPLATLLLIRGCFPGADAISTGVAVVLAGTPLAVACYVVSCQQGIERSFVAALLVISTSCSVITIPVWMYVLKTLL